MHKVDPLYPILAYTSSVGEIGIIEENFYRSGDNGAFQGLYPINKMNQNIILYILASLQKQFLNFGYDTGMSNIMDIIIKLPTKNNEIDYNYMDNYIKELKQEHANDLEIKRNILLNKFLKVTVLDNYILSDKELDVINKIKDGKINFKKFDITGEKGIFKVDNTPGIEKEYIRFNSGVYPYCTAQKGNNSVQTYISYDKKFINKGNSIMIGGKTLIITYQKQDYFSNDSHNLKLYLKNDFKHSENIYLFLVSALYKSLKPKYVWNASISKAKIQNDCLILPINDKDEINFEFIETYITAIKKLVIKDIVNYKDKIIDKTKEIIT